MGIFAGDGGYTFDPQRYKYRIQIFAGFPDGDYYQRLISFFTNIFGKPPQHYIIKENHVHIIRYDSKEIYILIREYLTWQGNKTHSIKLKKPSCYSKSFSIGFLRGLFDTDGNFYKPKNRVAYGTASKEIAFQICKIMKKLGFKHSCYKHQNIYRIDLYGKNAIKFIRFIKPRNKTKIIRLLCSGST